MKLIKNIEEVCNNIILFHSLPPEDKIDFDWLTDVLTNDTTLDVMYQDFTKAMVNWYFHLMITVKDENFELAEKLKQVIDIEVYEFQMLIYNRFEGIDIEKEKQTIKQIEFCIRREFDI